MRGRNVGRGPGAGNWVCFAMSPVWGPDGGLGPRARGRELEGWGRRRRGKLGLFRKKCKWFHLCRFPQNWVRFVILPQGFEAVELLDGVAVRHEITPPL